ncbi:hypothetical protein V8C42DRAFT_271398 [Trichoderma barbatum]
MLHPGTPASPPSGEFCRPTAIHRSPLLFILLPPARKRSFSFLFSSLALFAFWLRSSVVSVLFSLISERSLRRPIVIILIFDLGAASSVLAHDSAHSVPGITLPPGDATLFITCLGLPEQ